MKARDPDMVPFLDTITTTPKREPDGLTTEKLAIGDVCHLRSGSPKMTVTALLENDVIEVTWCKFEEAEMQVWRLPLAAIMVNK